MDFEELEEKIDSLEEEIRVLKDKVMWIEIIGFIYILIVLFITHTI